MADKAGTLIFDAVFDGSVQAQVDKLISSLEARPVKLKVEIDDSQLKSLKSQLGQIQKMSVTVGSVANKTGGNTGSTGKQESTSKVTAQIKAQQNALKQIQTLLNQSYKGLLKNPLNNAKDQAIAIKQISDLQTMLTKAAGSGKLLDVSKLESGYSNIAKFIDTSRAHTQSFRSALNDVSTTVKQLESGLNSVGKSSFGAERLKTVTSELKSIKAEAEAIKNADMSNPDNISRLSSLVSRTKEFASANKELSTASKAAAAALKEVTAEQKRSMKEAAKAMATAKQIDTMKGRLSDFLTGNRRLAGTQFESQINDLFKGLERDNITKAQLNDIDKKFKQIKISAAEAGKTGKTFGETIVGAFKKFGGWAVVTHSMQLAMSSIRQMVQNVRDLDAAMTELRKVTDESTTTYERFYKEASNRSKNIGASLSDTITATADFARLGYNLADASTLADTALVYKNVGDGISDINEASQSIISTMKAFGVEASDAMSITDKFNEVGKMLCPVA